MLAISKAVIDFSYQRSFWLLRGNSPITQGKQPKVFLIMTRF